MANTVHIRDDMIDLLAEIDLKSLLQKIAEKVKEHLDCAESSIFLYHPEKQELHFETVTGDRQNELKKIVMKKGEGIVGWIAEHEQGVIINDCLRDPRFSALTDSKTDFRTRSIAGVPVKMDGKLLGVIEAVNQNDGTFHENDMELLEYISRFVAIPLQNALLFKKTIQESNEKARLLELGKIISSTSNLDEIFQVMKDVIVEIIDPQEINVMVQSQRMLYKLLKNETIPMERKFEKTKVYERHMVFPLRTRNSMLGYLQIELEKPLPGEVVELIKGIAVFAAISIEKFELFKQILEKEKIEKEIQIAREIQQSFLINEKIPIDQLDFAFVNIPSSEVGGDYYDIIRLDNGSTIFTVNDISGHGIPASLLMSIFRANFFYHIKRDRNMVTTIKDLNNLIAETTDINQYVTSFSCLIDARNLTMKWINAGHVPPVVIRRGKAIELDEGGLVLGMFPDIPVQEAEFSLMRGDILALYTDGITEAENCNGQQFTLSGFIDVIRRHQGEEAESIKEKIIAELKAFVGMDDFDDDVTFILIKIQ
jgi:sigma-B regulation protein RsbU (phosphoserine phosphatase)